jgi:hypothetical protein
MLFTFMQNAFLGLIGFVCVSVPLVIVYAVIVAIIIITKGDRKRGK